MRRLLWAGPALFLGFALCASADTIVPGTQIQVRTNQPIDIHRWDAGRIYEGRVARDVFARDGDLAIPRDSPVELIVRRAGPDQMVVDIESVTVRGQRYVMDTSGPEFNVHRDEYQSGSGILGTIVGAISGGNAQVVTRGDHIFVPDNAMLTFQLQAPMHVGGGDPGYDRGGYHYHHDHDWYH